MSNGRDQLLEVINEIIIDVQDVTGNNTASLIPVRKELERAAKGISDEDTALKEVLKVAIEGIRECVKGKVSDVSGFIRVFVKACNGIERFLMGHPDGENLIKGAWKDLWDNLGRDRSKNPFMDTDDIASGEGAAGISLDDAALLLVQTDPDDAEGLEQLKGAFESIIGNKSLSPPVVREIMSHAAGCIRDILEDNVSDPQAALDEAGELIEKAMDAVDEDLLEPIKQKPSASKKKKKAKSVKKTGPKSISSKAEKAEERKDTGEDEEYLSADVDYDILGKFVIESFDLIEGAEESLLVLEKDPSDKEAVNTVFRAFHTIKGSGSYLGVPYVSALAHSAESLLSRIREGALAYTEDIADIALRSVDIVKDLMGEVQDSISSGKPIKKPLVFDDLINLLSQPESADRNGNSALEIKAGSDADNEQETGEEYYPDEERTKVIARGKNQAQHKVESSVRIKTSRLDQLIDMVGELVIAQSMVAQDESAGNNGNDDLQRKVSSTGKIVRELQDLTLSMRMVPMKSTFQKMTRLVRDLSHKSGKSINFITEGEDTEIDRNMVDVINDPLVHLVRNAIDHGIESPEMRKRKGKPATGMIMLSAYSAGGNIIVELRDDGKGLERDKIVQKALSSGLIESDQGMSERDVHNLIFEPGFSTAEEVTDISGRGVGLDIVKRGVEDLRGRIDISTEPGLGATFSMRLPLTLAITDGMLIQVGEQRYIIPTINILESIRPEKQDISTIIGKGEMFRLRDDLIPVVRLHRLFKIGGAKEDPSEGLLIIISDHDSQHALLVDELLDQQQVVIKSLSSGIGKVEGISGGAILGDGRVGLILDPPGIIGLIRRMNNGEK